jgi:hypothetical protein
MLLAFGSAPAAAKATADPTPAAAVNLEDPNLAFESEYVSDSPTFCGEHSGQTVSLSKRQLEECAKFKGLHSQKLRVTSESEN